MHHWLDKVRFLKWIVIGVCLFIIGCGQNGGDGDDEIIAFCRNDNTPCEGLGVSVTGRVTYEDRLYNREGFTGERISKPVRCADIEVVRNVDNPAPEDILASGSTDGKGEYCFTFANPGRTEGVYIRVYARTNNTYDPGLEEIKVVKFSDNSVYSMTSDPFDDSKASLIEVDIAAAVAFDPEIGIVRTGTAGPFNIIDVLADASRYVRDISKKTLPPVVVLWEEAKLFTQLSIHTWATFFSENCGSFGQCIMLNGGDQFGRGDHDEYDDDVMLHEYGHFVDHNLSKLDSPGGPHSLIDSGVDIRLAWSEGWATFFSSAVRSKSSIVDTNFLDPPSNSIRLSYDIESGACFLMCGNATTLVFDRSVYSTNETAVSMVLWDIFDQANEGHDPQFSGMTPIWEIMGNYIPGLTEPGITIERFWDGWIENNPTVDISPILQERQIEFFEDIYENDGSISQAHKTAIGEDEHHTLYPSGDIDYVAFDVIRGTTYTIETFDLSNGADTYLDILSSNGDILAHNDNWFITLISANCNDDICGEAAINDNEDGVYINGCKVGLCKNDDKTFASRVEFTPPEDGQYYARISRSQNVLPMAGRYGSYFFRIILP